MNYKPDLTFYVDEIELKGGEWIIPFTPSGTGFDQKMSKPVPDSEMQQIGKAAGVSDVLDGGNIVKHWPKVENRVKDSLLAKYWSPSKET